MTRQLLKIFILFLFLTGSTEIFAAISNKCKCCRTNNTIKIDTSLEISRGIFIINKKCCCSSRFNYCGIDYTIDAKNRYEFYDNSRNKETSSHIALNHTIRQFQYEKRIVIETLQSSLILKIETIPIYLQNSSFLI